MTFVRPLSLFLLASSMLAGCQHMQASTASPEEVLESMKGPNVSGVEETMLKMAQSAEEKGDFRAAAQTYQQLLDKNPNDTSLALLYGESLRRSGNAKGAIEIFDKILTNKPDNLDAREGKGLSQLSLADLDAASQTLSAVAEQSPNRWRTLNGIGILFATRGLYEDATTYFDAALQQRPDHPAIINNKGLVLALDRQFHAAITNLLQAGEMSKSPAHKVQADLNAALVYAIAGDLDNAEVMASNHLEGPALQNNLGLYALLAKDEGLARTHLHMALSESKVFYEKAWNNLDNIGKSGRHHAQENNKGKRISLSEQVSDGQGQPPSLPQPGSAATTHSRSIAPVVQNKPVPKSTAGANKTDTTVDAASNTPPAAEQSGIADSAPSNTAGAREGHEPERTHPLLGFFSQFQAVPTQSDVNEKETTTTTGTQSNINTASGANRNEAEDQSAASSSENDAASAETTESSTEKKEHSTMATEDDGARGTDNTPGGVSPNHIEPSSGKNDLYRFEDGQKDQKPPQQTNGFQSLEQFIKNW